MNTLFLATGNAHKAREFQQMFSAALLPWTIAGAAAFGGMPPVEESADTFSGNALIKARALRSLAPKGAWILADDSGLEVAALGGAPGVYSARYAGKNAKDADNTAKLLRALADIPDAARAARFVCVLALIQRDGAEKLFEGECPGRIGRAPAGVTGFGYDPVFFPDGFNETFAELGDDVKNRISHRARALEKLFTYLRSPEFDSEQHWVQSFAASQDKLTQMAEEALREFKTGKTRPLDLDRDFPHE